MAYNVYSLPDCKTVLSHPDVGTANLHQCGHGKITISSAGDLTSHTATADGYVVVNKLKSTRDPDDFGRGRELFDCLHRRYPPEGA